MEIIAQLETSPRRIYTGTIGFIGPGRRAQFNVAIRTLLWNRRTRQAEYGVGSGITWVATGGGMAGVPGQDTDSHTRAPAFSLVETMLWTAGEGYFLLARHLERLAQSALYFGFATDMPALRLELERLAARRPAPQKVRLLVSERAASRWRPKLCRPPEPTPQRVTVAPGRVDSSDPFLYHKTTNRGLYETARAACPGYDDVLLLNERGEVTESTIANVAVEMEGKLCTPPVQCGLLPGTLRADLLGQGTLIERCLTVEQLLRSPRVFLLNSVRGLYQVQVVAAPPSRTNPGLEP